MSTYTTLDYLPDLTPSQMSSSWGLVFYPSAPNNYGWDYTAAVSGAEPYALLHGIYHFNVTAGATLSLGTSSFFDPYILEVFDSQGNAISANITTSPTGNGYSAIVTAGFVAPYTGTYYVEAGWHQGSYYTGYALLVTEDVSIFVSGTTWDDTFYIGSQNKTIDGGAGFDTIVFTGLEWHYTIAQISSGFVITDVFQNDGTVTETNVEKLQFADHTLTIAAAPNETLLEAYRIYKAAFDRTPDYGGLGYWYDAMNHGASLISVANGFIHSAEFVAMYGSSPTDSEFVSLVYHHVLGRALDQAGFDFWLNDLHVETRAQVLAHFSESAENIANLAGVVSHGIIYEAYTV